MAPPIYISGGRPNTFIGPKARGKTGSILAGSDSSYTPITSFTKSIFSDGINDSADAADSSVHNGYLADISEGISLCGWVKMGDTTGIQVFYGKRQTSPVIKGFVAFSNGAKVRAQILAGGVADIDFETTANVLTTGVWTHFAVTHPGDRLAASGKIYINGVSQDLTFNGGPENESDDISNTGTFQFCTETTQYLHGYQCDIATFKKELTSTEVSLVYNSGTRHDLRGLYFFNSYNWFYYPCGDAPGDDDTDDTGQITDLGSDAGHVTPRNGITFAVDSP